jgi:phage baseplate assembly protein W
MAQLRDVTFNYGEYGRAAEYVDSNAVILAIRNILLSKPGNFPFTPEFGMNIAKYQFDILDETQVNIINNELQRHISQYLPSMLDVQTDVRIVPAGERLEADSLDTLGIYVSARINQDRIESNFLVYTKDGELNIINTN